MGFIIITALLASAYLLLQLFYLFYWWRTNEIIVPDDFIPGTAFSVVVVARNEEKSIEQCIRAILQQKYPEHLFEVIVVNDRSTDRTVEIVKKIQSPNLMLLNQQDYPEIIHATAYKKSAIDLAVQHAQYDWIVVTDADCLPSPEWLRTISYAQSVTGSLFLASSVTFINTNSFLEKMQTMEMMVLMLITAAGIKSGLHDMANGANMVFSKKAFQDVNGYEGNYQYASGDDMFLIEKMRAAFPKRISFVKSINAVVSTTSKQDWKSLLKQRIRWAGKNKGLHSPVITMTWLFIGMYHLMILLTFGFALFQLSSWWPFLVILSVKWMADLMIMHQATKFFKMKSILVDFIPLQVMYSVYILRLGWNLMLGRKGDW